MKIYNTELDKRRKLNLCEITGTNLWPCSNSSFRKVLESQLIRLQTVSGYRRYPVTYCIRLQTVFGYDCIRLQTVSSYRQYPVTDCIRLQTVFGYRLYPVTDCILLQTMSGYRLYPLTDGIRLQTVSGYRLYSVTDWKFRKLSFFKTEVKDFNLIRAIFFYFDFIYWEFKIWHTGLYNTVKLRFVGRKPSMFWLYDPSQPKHQSNQDLLL